VFHQKIVFDDGEVHNSVSGNEIIKVHETCLGLLFNVYLDSSMFFISLCGQIGQCPGCIHTSNNPADKTVPKWLSMNTVPKWLSMSSPATKSSFVTGPP